MLRAKQPGNALFDKQFLFSDRIRLFPAAFSAAKKRRATNPRFYAANKESGAAFAEREELFAKQSPYNLNRPKAGDFELSSPKNNERVVLFGAFSEDFGGLVHKTRLRHVFPPIRGDIFFPRPRDASGEKRRGET